MLRRWFDQWGALTTRRRILGIIISLPLSCAVGPPFAMALSTTANSRLAASSSGLDGSTTRADIGASGSDWLAEINRYRTAAGLAAVSDEPAWDVGLQHHLTYLEKTPAGYMTDAYASAHTENPASPYYTSDGALEAGYSDLAEGGAGSAVEAVDRWLQAPFHAVGMLRAQLTRVALADDPTTGYAGLDVIQGLDETHAAASGPILFPGPGMTTNLLTYGGESPDPLETCGWSGASSVGLPLIVLAPQAPSPSLSATLSGPGGGASSSAGTLCVVDELTYRSSDQVYGPTGAEILRGDHAVFLIPRHPLTNGTYSVTVRQPGQPDLTWSFNAATPAPVNLTPPAIHGAASEYATLSATTGSWTNTPTAYAHSWLRCNPAGSACRGITGANSDSYRLGPADVGSTIRVSEIARNLGGSGSPALSAPTAVIRAVRRITRTTIRNVLVRSHSVEVLISTPAGTRLRCALTPRTSHGFGRDRFDTCWTDTTYDHVANGRYRFTVKSDKGTATRQIRVPAR